MRTVKSYSHISEHANPGITSAIALTTHAFGITVHCNAFFAIILAKDVGGRECNNTAIPMLSGYTESFGRTGQNS